MLKYGTCGKKMDIDLDKMKTTNAKENKDEDRFFLIRKMIWEVIRRKRKMIVKKFHNM